MHHGMPAPKTKPQVLERKALYTIEGSSIYFPQIHTRLLGARQSKSTRKFESVNPQMSIVGCYPELQTLPFLFAPFHNPAQNFRIHLTCTIQLSTMTPRSTTNLFFTVSEAPK